MTREIRYGDLDMRRHCEEGFLVKFKDNIRDGRWNSVGGMDKYKGTTCTISKIKSSTEFYVKEDNNKEEHPWCGHWTFYDDNIEYFIGFDNVKTIIV